MRKTILTLIMILLISGCTGSDFFQGLMPGFEDQEVKELPPDIISIESLTVIPNPPINANDQFTVSYIIKNQDDINSVDFVEYKLFDDGLCNWSTGSPSGDKKDYPSGFVPLQEEFIDWLFDAPENNEIASLSTTCPIRFYINYSFLSRSQIDVQVIGNERLKELQRSGESVSFTPTLTLGRGPVKVYLSFGAALPVRGSTTNPPNININKLPLYITVEDKGNGLYGHINAGDLIIRVPDDFTLDECEKFNSGGPPELGASGYNLYTNKEKIDLIRKKTAQIRCSFNVPSVTLEKTFYFTGFVDYHYTITGETEVAIEPTA